MHEVYTAQRPGRPGRSLAAAAILLLMTVAVAEALILYREKAVAVQFGSRNQFSEGGLFVRLPSGWVSLPAGDRPPGAVIGLEDPETKKRHRRLFVLRGTPRAHYVPSSGGPRGPEVILDLTRTLGADNLVKGQYALEPLGGLPGVTALAVPGHLAVEEVDMPFCLCRAAIGPGGEVVGVLIQSDTPPSATERKLLDDVCASVELENLSLDFDSGKAMAAAGIGFKAPSDARFIGPVDPDVPRVRMMGGSGRGAWYLDLYRAPLVGKRNVAGLVEDHAMSASLEVRLPETVETFEVKGRPTARTNLTVSGREPTMHLFAMQADPHTAVLMIGRHETGAAELLRKLCEGIAAEAKVEPYDGLIDVNAAMDAGRRLIRETREQGMSTMLERQEGKELRFRDKAPALKLGTWTESCRRVSDGGKITWELTSEGHLKPAWMLGEGIVIKEKWRLAEGGVEYGYEYHRTEIGQFVIRQEERCGPEGRQVLRGVETIHGARRDTISVDDTFASEPLAMLVAARIARDSNLGPVIVSQIDTFTAGTVYQVMRPIGKTTPPGSLLRELAWTVRVTTDYSPEPVLLYFDDQGDLLAASSDGQCWQERIEEPMEADGPSGPAKRGKR